MNYQDKETFRNPLVEKLKTHSDSITAITRLNETETEPVIIRLNRFDNKKKRKEKALLRKRLSNSFKFHCVSVLNVNMTPFEH